MRKRSFSCLPTVSREGSISRGVVSKDALTFSGQSQFPLDGSIELTFHGIVTGTSLSGTTEMTSPGAVWYGNKQTSANARKAVGLWQNLSTSFSERQISSSSTCPCSRNQVFAF